MSRIMCVLSVLLFSQAVSVAAQGLSPEEAARAMKMPPGFSVTLCAGEPEIDRKSTRLNSSHRH